MCTQSSTILQRVRNYCNVLRDAGISCGEHVEQRTYLLFLKMDHESATRLDKPSAAGAVDREAPVLSRAAAVTVLYGGT